VSSGIIAEGTGADRGYQMGLAPAATEEIRDGDRIVAIIIRASFDEPGVRFFSENHYSQQLGVINYPSGHRIAPHVHNRVPREVMYTQETLFIRSGRIRVDLYRDDRTYLDSRELGAGDVILLSTGGHGFEIIEECSMLEVKQGPYVGEGDKTRFEPASRP
jgi:mannose-6-phosphate isomerase-like protein (cupin superfamily)